MRGFILTVAAALVLSPVIRADDAAKELDGTYTLKSMTIGSEPAPDKLTAGVKSIVIKDGTFEVQFEDRKDIATFKVDATKKPAQIDLSPMNQKGKTRLGIYKIEKGEVTMVVAREGDRPADFDAKGEMVMKLIMVKKAAK